MTDVPQTCSYPERSEAYKDIHVYHTKDNTWSQVNHERELQMETVPYVFCYRVPHGEVKGVCHYPMPRVTTVLEPPNS